MLFRLDYQTVEKEGREAQALWLHEVKEMLGKCLKYSWNFLRRNVAVKELNNSGGNQKRYLAF